MENRCNGETLLFNMCMFWVCVCVFIYIYTYIYKKGGAVVPISEAEYSMCRLESLKTQEIFPAGIPQLAHFLKL